MNARTSVEDFESLSRFVASSESFLVKFSKDNEFVTKRIEVEQKSGKVFVLFLDEWGTQIWLVEEVTFKNEELVLRLSRNLRLEKTEARILATRSSLELEVAESFADFVGAKIIKSIGLDGSKFILEKSGQQIALFVAKEGLSAESCLSQSLLWLRDLLERKNTVQKVFVLLDERRADKLTSLCALLRNFWKDSIFVYRKATANSFELVRKDFQDLWTEKPPKWKLAKKPKLNELLQRIAALAPEKIEAVASQKVLTLEFLGLPFLFVEKNEIFFGVGSKTKLTTENFTELEDLVNKLKEYRHFSSPNQQHAFYELMPERWLEFLLRSNIETLDSNFFVLPVYSQLRIEEERVDLLAFTHDGKIAVIEIKVEPNRDMLFQALDYWRNIELARRNRAFQETQIVDKSAIIYLVAPGLGFHKDLEFFARTLRSEIEIYRVDLNQDWRREIKVLQKRKL